MATREEVDAQIEEQERNMPTIDKLNLIYSAVEEMQQDMCIQEELNELEEEWLEASPALLLFLSKMIQAEEKK